MTTNEMTDIDVLARTIWGEARGESLEGQIAVGWVIMNRVNTDLGNDNKPDWWGEGIKGICLKKFQFSCWLPNDPNEKKILELDTTSTSYKTALMVAQQVVEKQVADPTHGATYYHTKQCVPEWACKLTFTVDIGNHVFYKS